MRILYAFQGTGNGHAARARVIVPEIAKHASVDVATSGTNSQLSIGFPLSFRLRGLPFTNDGRGALSKWQTVRSLRIGTALKDISCFPIERYDLVVNDFEPITAYAARRAGIPAIALSHQASFLSENTPRPAAKNPLAEAVLKLYAPAPERLGFHFKRYADFILPPLLRDEIRHARVENEGHTTVYLPGYDDQNLLEVLQKLTPKPVHLFSRQARHSFSIGNVSVEQISSDRFVRSLVTCDGLLTGAGFEGPAEALHLGKKLMVVPLEGQYEQLCNAAALSYLGVPVITAVDESQLYRIQEWSVTKSRVDLQVPDVRQEVLDRILTLTNPG